MSVIDELISNLGIKRKKDKEIFNRDLDDNINLMLLINTKDLDRVKLHIEDLISKNELNIGFIKMLLSVSDESDIKTYLTDVVKRIRRDDILNDLEV